MLKNVRNLLSLQNFLGWNLPQSGSLVSRLLYSFSLPFFQPHISGMPSRHFPSSHHHEHSGPHWCKMSLIDKRYHHSHVAIDTRTLLATSETSPLFHPYLGGAQGQGPGRSFLPRPHNHNSGNIV